MTQNASIIKLLFFLAFLSCSFQVMAQFTVTEDFRGSAGPDIIVGDDAKLTSGEEDPVGAGWLRLTSDAKNQKGYAYINKSFPSTQGILIDFEYTMWRNEEFTYNGADGISVFLFDADYGPGNFDLGAYGGSLGYANSEDVNPENLGLTGGYIGIGLDAFGNFTHESEEKNGGSTSESPNSVTLRGATTGSMSTTNPYLDGATITGVNPITTDDAENESGDASFDGIDYNTITSTRPDINTFYRRVQIKILPVSGGNYDITLRMATGFGGSFTELISYTTSTPPPPLLKLGFAASTGEGVNNHEIKNLTATTLGDLRLIKMANKNVLRSRDPNEEDEDKIEYAIEITNDTKADLTDIDFEDILTDANGDPIPNGMFKITEVSHTGFDSSGTTLPNPSNSNPITEAEVIGSVAMEAESVGVITIKGTLDGIPAGNILSNTAEVTPNSITDDNPTNNISTVNTPVISEGVDLVVDKEVMNSCLDSNGNKFSLTVSNVGSNDLDYHETNNYIKVTDTLPSGTNIDNILASDWEVSNNGNVYTFKYPKDAAYWPYWQPNQGTLKSGHSLPEITFTLKDSDNSGYENFVDVELKSNGNVTTEPPENRYNNRDGVKVLLKPNTLSDKTIYLCEGEQADPLDEFVEPNNDNELIWYLNEGGTPSNIAFTPNTSQPGETIYFVSQTNGACESELTEIKVIVYEEPDAGSINTNTQEVCKNKIPGKIESSNAGSGEGNITYQWEFSTNNGDTWEIIDGENDKDLEPEAISVKTQFRRRTISTKNDKICESEATDAVTISIKNCKIITNPMLPSKAKK